MFLGLIIVPFPLYTKAWKTLRTLKPEKKLLEAVKNLRI